MLPYKEDEKELYSKDCTGYILLCLQEGDKQGVYSCNRLPERSLKLNSELIRRLMEELQELIDSSNYEEETTS